MEKKTTRAAPTAMPTTAWYDSPVPAGFGELGGYGGSATGRLVVFAASVTNGYDRVSGRSSDRALVGAKRMRRKDHRR